ncbi:zinc metalloproteinase nas-13-like [Belonocnema kinseyi]|uniref:zinc metalloproteinase nas-13-like n=1 Tax=Belonocnema kinseyi TaxID=2817044 RepID=UPI00143CCBE2|nr:zinc metalloproteinase nas-13-like [Belonocnema kinseyi]
MSIKWVVLIAVVVVGAKESSAGPYFRRDVLDNAFDSPDGLLSHLSHLERQLYADPSNETGLKVSQWHEGLGVNPEELGEYVEGDILFPSSMSRNGLKASSARWPDGVIPYIISPFFNEEQQNVIQEAMADYHRHTCIRFKPYAGVESDYIRITAGNTGCWSSVGRIGGRQDINLQVPGCIYKKGTVIHELMHVVGFLHEQSRYERDEFVIVQWQNILRGHEVNFEKSSRQTTDAFGIGYDYASVMHYSPNAFSKNGQPTIIARGAAIEVLGQRSGFSKRDIQKIRRMYKCGTRRESFNDFLFY